MGGEQVADQHRARELLVLGPGLVPQTLVHRVRDADIRVLVPPAPAALRARGLPGVELVTLYVVHKLPPRHAGVGASITGSLSCSCTQLGWRLEVNSGHESFVEEHVRSVRIVRTGSHPVISFTHFEWNWSWSWSDQMNVLFSFSTTSIRHTQHNRGKQKYLDINRQ